MGSDAIVGDPISFGGEIGGRHFVGGLAPKYLIFIMRGVFFEPAQDGFGKPNRGGVTVKGCHGDPSMGKVGMGLIVPQKSNDL